MSRAGLPLRPKIFDTSLVPVFNEQTSRVLGRPECIAKARGWPTEGWRRAAKIPTTAVANEMFRTKSKNGCPVIIPFWRRATAPDLTGVSIRQSVRGVLGLTPPR